MNGMIGNEDADSYFDDDFPDIAADEYQRLEQDAISFTQRDSEPPTRLNDNSLAKQPSNPSLKRLGQNGIPELQPQRHGQNHAIHRNHRNVVSAPQNSSGGTILDEDGLPVVIEERPQRYLDETTEREQWRVNRFAQQQVKPSVKSPVLPTTAHHASRSVPYRQAQSVRHDALPSRSHHGVGGMSGNAGDDALRVKVAELMRERDELSTKLRTVQDEVYVRRGEVANIRAKQSDAEKAHQRQLAVVQRSMQEDADKHAASVQAMKAENARVASEMQFLRQELKEESGKAQKFQRQLKERPLTDKSTNINGTPKRRHALRDGFDDDEIMIVSPVKSGRRSKQNTPTANRKRKQTNGIESNVQPLPLRLSSIDAPIEVQPGVSAAKADQNQVFMLKDHATTRHLHLIQRVTNFRPSGGHQVLLQRLFEYSFPSDPKTTFGSIVVDAIARLEGQRLPGDLIQIFVGLWSRAKQEEYYTCLSLLVEVITYIIDLDPLVVDGALLKSILPILQSTIDINAAARFHLMRKDYLDDPSRTKPKIDPRIDSTRCLELLHTLACLVTGELELISLFWRSISTDTILGTLLSCQPIPDIILMLQILSTSILDTTFGPICEVAQQNSFETYICDRVFYLLWETPKPDADQPVYSQTQICLLRQESLNFLSQLSVGSSLNGFNPSAAKNHGTNFLVSHPTAASRLVRSVYDELAAAYHMTPTQPMHVRLVNTAVRILHFVLFSPAGRQVNLQSKINGINGGAHRFRVVMARLAYAESNDPGIDAGISDDTVRMATELLEESVTPDEIDDLERVFEGDGPITSRRTSVMTSTQR